MDPSLLLRGLVIGFSIAAPVGPIGVLCISRTLAGGLISGLISGLGAATADAIYGCVAGFGLTFLSSFLIQQKMWLSMVGGLFLCYLGLRTFLAKPAEQSSSAPSAGSIGAYASTFVLTLTNPMTILSFTAIFAGLGIGSVQRNYLSAAAIVLGVFTGSSLWWLVLTIGVSTIRSKFNPQRLRWVNRVSGAVISGFGVLALMSAV
jgi:threonine/homoserine/homoserine lactone efflux protein